MQEISPHLDEFSFNPFLMEDCENLFNHNGGVSVMTRTSVKCHNFHGISLLVCQFYSIQNSLAHAAGIGLSSPGDIKGRAMVG